MQKRKLIIIKYNIQTGRQTNRKLSRARLSKIFRLAKFCKFNCLSDLRFSFYVYTIQTISTEAVLRKRSEYIALYSDIFTSTFRTRLKILQHLKTVRERSKISHKPSIFVVYAP